LACERGFLFQQRGCRAGASRRGHGGKLTFILFEAARRLFAGEFRQPRNSSNTSVAHLWANYTALIHISSREKTGAEARQMDRNEGAVRGEGWGEGRVSRGRTLARATGKVVFCREKAQGAQKEVRFCA